MQKPELKKVMRISFCNGNRYPCGCRAWAVSGDGEYSDGITVELCDQHMPEKHPDETAKEAGYVYYGSTWRMHIP